MDIKDGSNERIRYCEQIGELILGENNNDIDEILKFSWYWYIKAMRSTEKEEQLLYCWILLEEIAGLDLDFENEFMKKRCSYSKNELVSKIIIPIICLHQPKEMLCEAWHIFSKVFYKNYGNEQIDECFKKNIK